VSAPVVTRMMLPRPQGPLAQVCQLAQFSDAPCEGRLVRCHLIPQQVIRRELRPMFKTGPAKRDLENIVWDPRTWVWACGGFGHGNMGHHGLLDNPGGIEPPRAALPDGVEEFALEWDSRLRDHGHTKGWPFQSYLERTYGH
jgi:hypothetical protein